MADTGMKRNFFDRAAVLEAMDRKTVRALGRAGVIIQRAGKRLLKYGQTVSSPGSPPTVHKTSGFTRIARRGKKAGQPQPVSPLRELVFYAYDPASKSTVVGPEIFRNAKSRGAPKALEKGGEVQVTKRDGTTTIQRVEARPFMLPALQSKVSVIPQQFSVAATGPLK